MLMPMRRDAADDDDPRCCSAAAAAARYISTTQRSAALPEAPGPAAQQRRLRLAAPWLACPRAQRPEGEKVNGHLRLRTETIARSRMATQRFWLSGAVYDV